MAPGATKVNAELYKLLVYREGDFFHQHQDAQLSTRMFANLLVFLPVRTRELESLKTGKMPMGVLGLHSTQMFVMK